MLQLQLRDGHLLYIMLLTPGFVTLPVLRLQWTLLVSQTCYTAFVTDVLHCLCYERVTLLVWQTCYAACAVLRTLMWCSRTCGPCNSLMPFSWSQNSTENTKTNTNTKASYIEDILMQWSWKPFSSNQSTSSTTHCNCLMYWCLRWSGDRKPTDWWSRVEHFVRLLWCFVLKSFR